jgi:hypothetical protein
MPLDRRHDVLDAGDQVAVLVIRSVMPVMSVLERVVPINLLGT